MMVNLNQLRSFYMVAKYKSVSVAAEKMFVTPPPVTMQIKKLEDWLGSSLFHREKKSLRLRDDVKDLYHYAQTIFGKVEELEAYLDQRAKEKKSELLLGAHHMIGRFIAPRLIAQLKKVYPHLNIKVILGNNTDLMTKLTGQEIQCILVADRPRTKCVKTVPLFDENIVLVAAANSQFVNTQQITIDELSQLPLLMQQHDTHIYLKLKTYLEKAGVSPRIVMDNLSGDVILGFLLQDVGVAFTLRFTVQDSIDRGLLQEVEVEGGLPQAQIGLAFLAEKADSSHLHPLVSWLEATTFDRSQLV